MGGGADCVATLRVFLRRKVKMKIESSSTSSSKTCSGAARRPPVFPTDDERGYDDLRGDVSKFLEPARKRVKEATFPAAPPRSWRHSVFFWRRFPRKKTAARWGRAAADGSGGASAQISKPRCRAASGRRLVCFTPSTTADVEDHSAAAAEIAYVALRHYPMEGGAAAGVFGPIYLVT